MKPKQFFHAPLKEVPVFPKVILLLLTFVLFASGTYFLFNIFAKSHRRTSNPNPTTSTTPTSSTSPISDVSDCSLWSAKSSYDTLIVADNPTGYWDLGSNDTYICDRSTSSIDNGKYVNAPLKTTTPNNDNALVFNGSNQYLEIPDANKLSIPTSGILTLEAWMRPDTLQFSSQEDTGYVNWLGKGITGAHEYVARMYSYTNSENRPNRISGYSFNLSGGLGAGSYFQDPVTAGQWIHYVLVINTVNKNSTYPSGYTKIYKNGSVRDQDSLAAYSIVPGNGTAPLRIGTRDLNSFFKGGIGKVAIYNFELSSTQVLNHYNKMLGL